MCPQRPSPLSQPLPIFDRLAGTQNEFSAPAHKLGGFLKEGKPLPSLTNTELFVLQKALKAVPQNYIQTEN